MGPPKKYHLPEDTEAFCEKVVWYQSGIDNPKPSLLVDGVPLAHYLVENLSNNGMEEIARTILKHRAWILFVEHNGESGWHALARKSSALFAEAYKYWSDPDPLPHVKKPTLPNQIMVQFICNGRIPDPLDFVNAHGITPRQILDNQESEACA